MGLDLFKNDKAALIIAAFLLVAISGSIVFFIQDWRWSATLAISEAGYQKQLSEIDRTNSQKLAEQQDRRLTLESKLATLSKKNYEELENAKEINNSLIADLANARKRLSISVSSRSCNSDRLPQASAARGMDHETTRADIDAGYASAIIAITNRGDEAIRQLKACQNYVQELSK